MACGSAIRLHVWVYAYMSLLKYRQMFPITKQLLNLKSTCIALIDVMINVRGEKINIVGTYSV